MATETGVDGFREVPVVGTLLLLKAIGTATLGVGSRSWWSAC
jgi:hypothetical protein